MSITLRECNACKYTTLIDHERKKDCKHCGGLLEIIGYGEERK